MNSSKTINWNSKVKAQHKPSQLKAKFPDENWEAGGEVKLKDSDNYNNKRPRVSATQVSLATIFLNSQPSHWL